MSILADRGGREVNVILSDHFQKLREASKCAGPKLFLALSQFPMKKIHLAVSIIKPFDMM